MDNYSEDELRDLGITFGEQVAIHRSVIFFGASRIRIASRVRIDCHTLLSAGPDGIDIGCNVHLAAGGYYFGSGGRITLEDFAGLSARVIVYTASDDFTQGWLTGPTIPDQFKNLTTGPVTVRRHSIVGAGSILLPGVTVGLACAVGAQSLVRGAVDDFTIVAGTPARKIGERNRRVLDVEKEYLASLE